MEVGHGGQAERVRGLDQLRGLAALSVVFHHCLLVFPAFFAAQSFAPNGSLLTTIVARSPLHLAWAGTEAVILFFVLSGFVLALPYLSGRADRFTAWTVKRVARIYLPYLAAIAGSLLLVSALGTKPTEHASTWFNAMWAHGLRLRDLADVLLMGGRRTHDLDTATWSLVHEMRISLVFPLMIAAVKRVDYRVSLLGAGFMSCIGFAQGEFAPPGSLWLTLFYSSFFVLGALAATHRNELIAELATATKATRLTLLGTALLLYLSRWMVPAPVMRIELFSGWMVASGALVLILLAASSGERESFLDHRLLVGLGTISYSLYLTHAVVLLTIVHVARGVAPLPVLIAAVPPISIAVAVAFHRLVEAPSAELGRQVARGMGHRRAAAGDGATRLRPNPLPLSPQPDLAGGPFHPSCGQATVVASAEGLGDLPELV